MLPPTLSLLVRIFVVLGALAWVSCAPVVPLGSKCQGVTCASGESCEAATGRCVSPTDAGPQDACTSDPECSGATPKCLVLSKTCVACLTDTDCAAGACDGVSHTCKPLPDSCALAISLDLSTGSAEVRGSTAKATNDTQLACALPGSTGADLVYRVVLNEPGRLLAEVRPADATSPLRPVLALKADCAASPNLACAFTPSTATSARLTKDGLSAGTYFLWVDSEGAGGAFVLNVTLETQTADVCSAVTPQVLEGAVLESLGDTRALSDDFAGSCGGQGGPDAIYAFTTTVARRIKIEAISSTPGYAPLVHVRQGPCDLAATELACVQGAGATATVDLPRQPPGTIYVFIDGATASSSGAFKLRVTPLAPLAVSTNDTCSTAEPLVFPAGVSSTLQRAGDTTGAKDDAQGCGADGGDLLYRFTIAAPKQFTARVVPLAGSALRPTLYLRAASACSSNALLDQKSCVIASAKGASTTLLVPNLPAGDWVLFVDGAQGSWGPFELQLDLAAPPMPPANDRCAGAQALTLTSGAATVNGTTLGAADDAETCAMPVTSASPDVLYKVVLTSQQALAIDVKASAGSSLRPVVSLQNPLACGTVMSQVACGVSDPQFPDRLAWQVPKLPAGEYALWVGGDDGTQGPFSLRVEPLATVAVPGNDSCASPLPSLTQGVAITGDTRAAANDVAAEACGLVVGADGRNAPDVAYQFTLLSSQSVTLKVEPDTSIEGRLFRPVLSVRGPSPSDCSKVATVKGCQVATDYGLDATLQLPNLTPGTYTVWVDGAGVSSGRFSLKFQ